MSVDKNSAAYKIGKPFRAEEEDGEPSFLEKAKAWIERQLSAKSPETQLEEAINKKKPLKEQLTIPKKSSK